MKIKKADARPNVAMEPNNKKTPTPGNKTRPFNVDVTKNPAHMGPKAFAILPPSIDRPLTLARWVDETDLLVAILKLEKEKFTATFLIPSIAHRKTYAPHVKPWISFGFRFKYKEKGKRIVMGVASILPILIDANRP